MLAQNLAISAAMIVVCVTIHAAGLYVLMNALRSRRTHPWRHGRMHRRWAIMIATVFFLLLLHGIEVAAFAALYVGLREFGDFETALYFSVTTFTTLGYGDIELDANHRLVAGGEGLIGLILIGWSTAILVAETARLAERGGRPGGVHPDEAPQDRNSP